MSRETAQQQERSRETLEPNLDTRTDTEERVGTKNLKDPLAPPPGVCAFAHSQKNEGFVHLHIHIKKGFVHLHIYVKKKKGRGGGGRDKKTQR